jgi:hypothetical protein
LGDLGLSAYAEKVVHFTLGRKGKMPCDDMFTKPVGSWSCSQFGRLLIGLFGRSSKPPEASSPDPKSEQKKARRAEPAGLIGVRNF